MLKTVHQRRPVDCEQMFVKTLLSLRGAASRLGLKLTNAHTLVRRGVLMPDYRNGREILFREERLDELQEAYEHRQFFPKVPAL